MNSQFDEYQALAGQRSPTCYERELARLRKERDELREALRYARRFLNSEDHDTAYVDDCLSRHKSPADTEPSRS